MKKKRAVKTGVDILMTLCLLFMMGYQFWDGARVGGRRDVSPFYCAPCPEQRMVQKSVQREVYGGPPLSGSNRYFSTCGNALPDGKRGDPFQPCVLLPSDSRRHVRGLTDAYGGVSLGICADGDSPGDALGHIYLHGREDGGKNTKDKDGDEEQFPGRPNHSHASGSGNRGVRTYRVYQAGYADIYVSAVRVRVSGLRGTGSAVLYRLSGDDGAVHIWGALRGDSPQENGAGKQADEAQVKGKICPEDRFRKEVFDR